MRVSRWAYEKKLGWDLGRKTYEAQISRLARSKVMSDVAVSVLSSFVLTAAQAAALSNCEPDISNSSGQSGTYTTPKLNKTISPILT